MNFRLEFKEQSQQWHYDRFDHEPNTFGWQTIAKCEPDEKLKVFTYWFDYTFLDTDTAKKHKWSTEFVKEQYKFFDLWYEYFKRIGADFSKIKNPVRFDHQS